MTFFRNRPFVVTALTIITIILCVVIGPLVLKHFSHNDTGDAQTQNVSESPDVEQSYTADENLLEKYGHPGLPAVQSPQILVDETIDLGRPAVAITSYMYSDDYTQAVVRLSMTPATYEAFLKEVSIPDGTDSDRLVLSEKTVSGLIDLRYIYATILSETNGKNPIGIDYSVYVL